MKVVFYKKEFSSYLHKSFWVRLVPLSFVWILRKIKCFDNEDFFISCFDNLHNFIKDFIFNIFDVIVDEPLTRSWNLAKCLSRRFVDQIERLNVERVDFISLNCFLTLLHKRSQILDIEKIFCSVIEKINSNNEFVAVNHCFFKIFESFERICQKSRFFFAYFFMIFIVMIDCNVMREVIIVKSDVQSFVHNDITLSLNW